MLFYSPRFQAFDTNGNVAAGAKLYFYTAGTTTAATVYSDLALSVPLSQPVVADSSGFFPAIYFANGNYKVVLQDANSVQLWSQDNCFLDSTGEKKLIGSTSPGLGSAQNAFLSFYQLDGTTQTAYVGFNSTSQFQIQNANNGGTVNVYAKNSSGTTKTLITADPAGAVTATYAGTTEISTADHTSTSATAGFQVKFADGTLRDVAPGVRTTSNTSLDYTVARTDSGKAIVFQGSSGKTITLPTTAATLPTGFLATIMNGGSASVSIAPGAGSSLSWYDGSGTVKTGTRTLAVAGTCTIWYNGSGFWYVLNGIGVS